MDGKSFVELLAANPADLANKVYNDWIAEEADEPDEGKAIPYLGWYWRDTDFARKSIPIGRSERGYIGVMENNKWGYASRYLTPAECDNFIAFIDRARAARDKGGNHADIRAGVDNVLCELREWMQSLEI